MRGPLGGWAVPIAKTVTVIGISILAVPSTLQGQAHRETIPFVGGPSQGQIGYVRAPEGESQSIDLDSVAAGQIAYYKGDNGPGVFAPRGWHCRGWEGSAGGTLVVSPGLIDSLGARPRLLGRAVELEGWEGGTSGRF